MSSMVIPNTHKVGLHVHELDICTGCDDRLGQWKDPLTVQ
jgi:hypothetical protein